MRILISGICGFVGSTVARELLAAGHHVTGFDSYIRPGSETNREPLEKLGAKIITADLRYAQEIDALPAADFVIDAAANASVLAGVDGKPAAVNSSTTILSGPLIFWSTAKPKKRASFSFRRAEFTPLPRSPPCP